MVVITNKEVTIDNVAGKVTKKLPTKIRPIKNFITFLGRFVKDIFLFIFVQKIEPRNKVESTSYRLNEIDATKTATMLYRYAR